jgi:hypothetical protein
MRTISRLLHGAMLALLILSLAAVTAAAAVRGNAGSGNGNAVGQGKDKDNKDKDDKGKGPNGNADAQPPGAPAAPSAPATPSAAPGTPPGQAKNTGTPAGQAKKTGTAIPGAAAPGQSGSASASTGDATHADDAPAPVPVAAPAPPELGRSMAVAPVSGAVQVRLPGSSAYVSLSDAGSIPTGSVVDARSGTLTLRSALDDHGRVQTATVRGAVFEVRQSRAAHGTTDLVLRGGTPVACGGRGTVRAASAGVTKKHSKPGALWVRDSHGRFRTRGRNSVATVRGTRWSTRETCAGTVTRVMQGAVDVRDLRSGRTVTVHRGHAYLARKSG